MTKKPKTRFNVNSSENSEWHCIYNLLFSAAWYLVH